ncbi:hypothetical protein [Nonomuraea sp. NEAU-A123]|uniref:hypothetical protein n=1 Tax=Nonomuraea sp. NEAU-A123 TaxID=2839649 RepID=UPI001BE45060|nr:hypothetical protein [Nonomuraea sp. NEAU-A123]MBT2226238.1 hypothetical protein [Nonomuraea sp. NEAU-A123]
MEITPEKLLDEAQCMALEIRLLRQRLARAEAAEAAALQEVVELNARLAQPKGD